MKTKKKRVPKRAKGGKKTVELYGKAYMSKLAKKMHRLRKLKLQNGEPKR